MRTMIPRKIPPQSNRTINQAPKGQLTRAGAVQPKMNASPQARKLPVAPAVYRPQPLPLVLQRKPAIAQTPPVYRPEPKQIVQPKVFSQQRTSPASPPIYQPQKNSSVQPKTELATQWPPKAPAIQRAQAKPVMAGIRTPVAQRSCAQAKAHAHGHTTRYSATRFSSTIQREIGPGGVAHVGRWIVGTDRTIAKITGAQRAGYMAGAKSPEVRPWLYDIAFYNGTNPGLVIESDPNWQLIPVAQENEYRRAESAKGWLIPLRSTELQAAETGIEYEIHGGKMYSKQGHLLNYADKVSFVITAEGRLLIGFLHTGLSKGHSTMMAGELTITHGVAEYDWRRTGHYYTTVAEQARGLEYMRKYYPWIAINQAKVDEQDRPKSLAELFQGPPVDMSFSFAQRPLRVARPKPAPSLSVPASSSSSSSSDVRGGVPSLSAKPSLPPGQLLDLGGIELPIFPGMSAGPSRSPGPSRSAKPSVPSGPPGLPPGQLLDLGGIELPIFPGMSAGPSRSPGPGRSAKPRVPSLPPSLPSGPPSLSPGPPGLPHFSSPSSESAMDSLRAVPLRPQRGLTQIFQGASPDRSAPFDPWKKKSGE